MPSSLLEFAADTERDRSELREACAGENCAERVLRFSLAPGDRVLDLETGEVVSVERSERERRVFAPPADEGA